MERTAVYGGSFDPFTLGHEDLVKRALKIFDRIIIVIAMNILKNGLFTSQERKELISYALDEAGLNSKVSIDLLEENKLLVDFAKEKKAIALLRSMRTVTDFEQEIAMAYHNRRQHHDLETIFIPPEFNFLSSSAVREIAKLGGRLDYMVRPKVEKALRQKYPAI